MIRCLIGLLSLLATAALPADDPPEWTQKLSQLQRWRELDRLGPEDLAKALPADAAFIEIISFTRFDKAPRQPDSSNRKRGLLAFVVASGRPVQRIDFDLAEPIAAAAAQWRADIAKGVNSAAATNLAKLVWRPIAKCLPQGTRTLYIAAEDPLHSIPWAALPGTKENTVLLEDFAIAHVPHSLALLEYLKFPSKAIGADSVVAVGAIDYGSSKYGKLPRSVAELKAVQAAAGVRPVTVLSGREATARRVLEALPQARHLHLATHGAFDAVGLVTDKKRAEAALANRKDAAVLSMRNPLAYVSLTFADGEALTGLSIVDLLLSKLHLAVLSADECALGVHTGGEGVQSLPLAFHLAGCANVIAPLWKVDDAATAALMAKFYYELWVNKKPPLEALREAQLTIYRHPELIPGLAGEHGAPRLKEAVAVKSSEPAASAAGVRRADTRHWAAFVLSGVGK